MTTFDNQLATTLRQTCQQTVAIKLFERILVSACAHNKSLAVKINPRTNKQCEKLISTTLGYTIAAAGESCKATCDAEQLACEPLMTANLTNVLKGLGQDCPSIPPYDAEDESQPYITTDGACHGISDVRNTSCDASKSGVRRLCRCEKPGESQTTPPEMSEAF